MTPEAQRSLEKAANCATTARSELAINLGSEAARNAYLAAFHAARAFIFERTSKVVKRHESVHREFTGWQRTNRRLTKAFSLFSRRAIT